MYVDIDVHHGDGVEEAFFTTDRVMTVSFHKYGDFFPGTGDLKDIGAGKGRLYSVNVPLKDGITDDTYESIFKPVVHYLNLEFVVADNDKSNGAFSTMCCCFAMWCRFTQWRPSWHIQSHTQRSHIRLLTIQPLLGHGSCVTFFRGFNVPLMIVGGGGYTPRNVARCWTYETTLAVDREVADG